eukprot:554889-Hanusia_phi.AAC.9
MVDMVSKDKEARKKVERRESVCEAVGTLCGIGGPELFSRLAVLNDCADSSTNTTIIRQHHPEGTQVKGQDGNFLCDWSQMPLMFIQSNLS